VHQELLLPTQAGFGVGFLSEAKGVDGREEMRLQLQLQFLAFVHPETRSARQNQPHLRSGSAAPGVSLDYGSRVTLYRIAGDPDL